MFSTFFFRKSYLLLDNVEKYGTAKQGTDDIIWFMRFACWIIKATDKHAEYVNTYCFSMATMVTPTFFFFFRKSSFIR